MIRTPTEIQDIIAKGLLRKEAPREIVIRALGGVCGEPGCGYSRYPEALYVRHRTPSKGKSSLKYWYDILAELPNPAYRLVCANCNAYILAAARKRQRILATGDELVPVVLWIPPVAAIPSVLTGWRIPWADSACSDGKRVFLVIAGGVYRYERTGGVDNNPYDANRFLAGIGVNPATLPESGTYETTASVARLP